MILPEAYAVMTFLISAAFAALSLRRSFLRGRYGDGLPVAAALAAAAAVAFASGAGSYLYLSLYLAFAILFSSMPRHYASGSPLFYVFALLSLAGAFAVGWSQALIPFVQMLGIGTVFGLIYSEHSANVKVHERGGKLLETRRDLFQAALGVVLFAIFLIFPLGISVAATAALFVLGYLFNGMAKSAAAGGVMSRAQAALGSLERKGAIFGSGAIYAGAGTMIVAGFIPSAHYILFGVAALFFADPAATIVGSHFGGRKLPHNRSKSIYGTLAFFLSLALVGYFLLGFLAVPFAAILAIAESVKWAVDGWAVDDNVAISVIYAAIYLLFISL